jgi:hypothetical protein
MKCRPQLPFIKPIPFLNTHRPKTVSSNGKMMLPNTYPIFSNPGPIVLNMSKALTRHRIEISTKIAPQINNKKPKNFFTDNINLD